MEERDSSEKKEEEATLHKSSVRMPLCYYYSSVAQDLQQEIDWCRHYFSTQPQRGQQQPSAAASPTIPILLVPHGAFCDSGPLVADAIQTCLSSQRFQAVLLIGTEHASRSKHKIFCSDHAQWATPLGSIPVDEDLLSAVATKMLPVQNSGFVQEHSIENQLPFLQAFLTEWHMLAINIHGNIEKQDLSYIRAVGKKLAALLSDRNDVAIVGSTDYTHAGPGYGEMPSSGHISVPEYIRMQDQRFLSVLCQPALPCLEKLWEHGKRISMRGLGATLLVSELAKNWGATKLFCFDMLWVVTFVNGDYRIKPALRRLRFNLDVTFFCSCGGLAPSNEVF